MSYLNYKCVVCGKRRYPNSNISLFRFPLDPDRCRLWVKFISKEDLAYVPIEKLHEKRFVCSLHFSQDAVNSKQNRLKKSAIPTLDLPHPPLTDEILKDFPLHVLSKQPKPALETKTVPLMGSTSSNLQKDDSSALSKVTKLSDKKNVEVQTAFKMPEAAVVVQSNESSKICNGTKVQTAFKMPEAAVVVQTNESSKICIGTKVQTAFKMPEATVVVQRNESSIICNRTKDNTGLTERENNLLKKLQNANVTLKDLASSSLNFEKIDAFLLKSIVINAIANEKKSQPGKHGNIDLKNKIKTFKQKG
ncbi:uncharacterized protein LOC123698675 isoform X3 [Colias croceus]|uniref:uncharacterized protein LOC123698675 isoform X2 n=1 Tax=Colias crocea TaxID=72248 RepID=UPI001E27ADFF|nr:uncharacterized protein LOC123698675 isoform X2 [Colias croceus]XP_045501389.1 uncharacterized protein LOC123698675 isoform X3 [Colias croceus]